MAHYNIVLLTYLLTYLLTTSVYCTIVTSGFSGHCSHVWTAKGRTNVELREQFSLAEGVSQTMSGFKSKMLVRQSSPSSGPAAAAADSSTCTHSPHTGATKVCNTALYFMCLNKKIAIWNDDSSVIHNLHWTDKAELLQRLRSGSWQHPMVPRTWLYTISDWSFRVTLLIHGTVWQLLLCFHSWQKRQLIKNIFN